MTDPAAQVQTVAFRMECAEIIEMLKSAATLAGYEVTLPGGNALIYGLQDEAVVATFREQLGDNAVEPLYKFASPAEASPEQTELFESQQ